MVLQDFFMFALLLFRHHGIVTAAEVENKQTLILLTI